MDISLQLWSMKDETPTEASWEACALGRWISVLSCITVSCSLAADGCVPTGWNDAKQAHMLGLCLSPWAESFCSGAEALIAPCSVPARLTHVLLLVQQNVFSITNAQYFGDIAPSLGW